MIDWYTVCIWLWYCRESSMQHSLEIEVAQVFLIPYGSHWSYRFREAPGPMKQPLPHPRVILSANPVWTSVFPIAFVSCVSSFLHIVAKAFVSSIVQLQKMKHFDHDKNEISVFHIFHEYQGPSSACPLAAGGSLVSCMIFQDTNSSTLQCAWAVLAWRFWDLTAAGSGKKYPPWN